MLVLNGAISSPFLLEVNQFTRVTSLILATWGFLIIRVAFKTYDLKQFLGTRFANDEEERSELITSGIRSRIRHPIYTGTILIVIGFWVFRPTLTHLTSVLCIFIYMVIGIMLEEKKLIRAYGDEYIKYREKVPMLIPRFKL